MGFKDGTRNIAGTETDRLKKFVWVGDGDGGANSAWMSGVRISSPGASG